MLLGGVWILAWLMEPVWLLATAAPRQKHATAGGRKRLGRIVCAPLVQQSLASVGLPSNAVWRAQDWDEAYEGFFNKIVGIALVRPLGEEDTLLYISPQQRYVNTLWEVAHNSRVSLLHFIIADACALTNPSSARFSNEAVVVAGANVATTVVCQLTEFSLDRLLAEQVADGRCVADVLRAWKARFPRVADRPLNSISLAAQHALLCARRIWCAYAWPIKSNRGRGELGLNAVARAARQVSAQMPDLAADVECSPELFQHLADALRDWAPGIAIAGHDEQEVARLV